MAGRPEWLRGYLTHELSHLHLQQHGGLFFVASIPDWFSEGLATLVSDGGGAMDVTDAGAIGYILQGRHFEPDLKGGIIFRKTAGSYGLRPHMFYRQAALFVSFMRSFDGRGFRELMDALNRGVHFREAYRQAYHLSIKELWMEFIKTLKEKTEYGLLGDSQRVRQKGAPSGLSR